MDEKRYKQAILVPEHITPTIFALPCVFSCHKEADGRIVYLLYDWDEQGQYVELRPGQWLCEDYDGQWHVETQLEHTIPIANMEFYRAMIDYAVKIDERPKNLTYKPDASLDPTEYYKFGT